MSYEWYPIFNYNDFLDTDLVSRKYTLTLEDIGEKDILVTRGNLLSILYEGVFLSINLNDRSPFYFEGYGVFAASDGQVYLGVEVDES